MHLPPVQFATQLGAQADKQLTSATNALRLTTAITPYVIETASKALMGIETAITVLDGEFKPAGTYFVAARDQVRAGLRLLTMDQEADPLQVASHLSTATQHVRSALAHLAPPALPVAPGGPGSPIHVLPLPTTGDNSTQPVIDDVRPLTA